MPTHADLGPTELAHRAATVYVRDGVGVEPLRLLFRALELDRYHVQAHAVLAALLIDAGWPEHGVALVEAALSPGRPAFGSEREYLETERLRHGLYLGFARRSDAARVAAFGSEDDLARLAFDEAAYVEFASLLPARLGSLEAAGRAAVTLAGFAGGAVAHESGAEAPGEEEFARPARFRHTPAYVAWLESDVSDDDA